MERCDEESHFPFVCSWDPWREALVESTHCDTSFPSKILLHLRNFQCLNLYAISKVCTVKASQQDGILEDCHTPPVVFSGEKIQLRDVKDFPLSLWLICLICVGYYTVC